MTNEKNGNDQMSFYGTDLFGNQVTPESRGILADNFLVVPFSILNAREAFWQERKRIWLSFGIKAEESGREDLKATGSKSGTVPGYFTMKEKKEAELGRELSHKEFEKNYLNDMLPKNSQIATTDTGGILSIFDPVLCELMYRWFAIKNGTVFDPFAGGSVRGVIAALLGLDYTGIDLSENQIRANLKQADDILCGDNRNLVKWINGNSCQCDELAPGNYDFLFSCPPYYDLEIYSNKDNDLSNMPWYRFKEKYQEIITKSVEMLKHNRFAVFVVGDIRDKEGNYRNLHGLTIDMFRKAGAKLYNELILMTTVASLPVRLKVQFDGSRKIGKTHQQVLVFVKGMPKVATRYIRESWGEK